MEQIPDELGMELKYNPTSSGYEIAYSNCINNIEEFFRFPAIVNTALLLSENLAERKMPWKISPLEVMEE
jgi:hypothetical protein